MDNTFNINMMHKAPLGVLFKKLLLNKPFNIHFYENGFEDDDIMDNQYIFTSALTWYLKESCLDEEYKLVYNHDFVKQVITGFESLYGKNQYVDELIFVGFIEVFLEFENQKTRNFLQLFSNQELIQEIIGYYQVIFGKKL